MIVGFSLILFLITSSCQTERIMDCGYNGKPIQQIQNQDALVREIDGQFFLYFEEGLKLAAPNLLDTIYLLLPCNLPISFQTADQKTIVSGEIQENPAYSSHNNYTDFHINKIVKN